MPPLLSVGIVQAFEAVYLFKICHNKKSSLFITFASRPKAVCSGIGDPVFVPAVDSGDGIHLPLMMVFCFRLAPTRSRVPSKRANAPVPVVSVVVVQRAVRVDVADVVRVRRIRRNKMYPKRFSSPRFVPLFPRGSHILYFKRHFAPIFATAHRNKAHFLRKLYEK